MIPIWILQSIETEEDRNLVEQLYDEYERLLYSVAFNYLRDSQRAEDAVHDTFLKLIPHLDKISEIRCPQTRGFLVTITEHICIDAIRYKDRPAETSNYIDIGPDEKFDLLDIIPDSYDSTEDRYFERYEVEQLMEAVRLLPDAHRKTLILYAAEGYSMGEIATIDGTTIEAVKKRIQRARKQLVRIMEDQLWRK